MPIDPLSLEETYAVIEALDRHGGGINAWGHSWRDENLSDEAIKKRNIKRGQILREIKQQPTYQGQLFRGEVRPSVPKKGTVVDLPKLTSTSEDRRIAEGFAEVGSEDPSEEAERVVWSIRNGRGADLREHPDKPYKNEREVVLPAGSRMLIRNVKKVESPPHHVVDAEQLYRDIERLDRSAMNGQSAVCDKRVWRPQDQQGGYKAAVRYPDGTVYEGSGHREAWHQAIDEGRAWQDDAEEGFTDPSGAFVTRKELHDATGILPKSGELRELELIDPHGDLQLENYPGGIDRHALNPYQDWKPAIWHPKHGIHTGLSHPHIVFKAMGKGIDLSEGDSAIDGFLRPDGSFATRADATQAGHPGESMRADRTGKANKSVRDVDAGYKGSDYNKPVWDAFMNISGQQSFNEDTGQYEQPDRDFGGPWWSRNVTDHYAVIEALDRIDVGGPRWRSPT